MTVEGRWQQGRWTGQSWGEVGFLTEEVQEAIAEVLKRDARLRQLEEGRIR